MVTSLLLDEGVSPSLVPLLAQKDIDAVALRDRGLLQIPDHEVWRYALAEDRTVITINGRDFRKLAATALQHPGIVVLPGGGSRLEQFSHIIDAVAWIAATFPLMPTFANYFVDVWEDGTISGLEVVGRGILAPQIRRSVH
jgi:predicted nuclease of predicted toxin-antitoxin system